MFVHGYVCVPVHPTYLALNSAFHKQRIFWGSEDILAGPLNFKGTLWGLRRDFKIGFRVAFSLGRKGVSWNG